MHLLYSSTLIIKDESFVPKIFSEEDGLTQEVEQTKTEQSKANA